MIAFAALIAQGAPAPAALAAHPQADTARALLSGQRPPRLAPPETLLAWAAEAAGTPGFLVDACLAASGDRAEVAALLLPPPQGNPPGLSEILATLTAAAALPPEARRAAWLALALALPMPARLVLNRLAAGTFRLRLKPDSLPQDGPRTLQAILTMIAPQTLEAGFALRHGNGLVPIARLPLTLAETPEILAWARAHVTERFGPNLALRPDLVFTLTCAGTTPNPRRKSGLDLVAARITAWRRDLTPDQADPLSTLRPDV